MATLGRLVLFCLFFLLKVQCGINAAFVVTADTSSITVTWTDTDVSGVANFTIELNDQEKYVRTDTTGGSKQITDLAAGTSYHLVITTTRDDGSTATSIDNPNQYTAPNPALNLRATAATVNSLTVVWDASTSTSVTKYTVQLKNDDGTKKTVNVGDTRTATFSDLGAGTQYAVVVVAMIGEVASDNLEANFYTVPEAVKDLSKDSLGTNFILLKWSSPEGVVSKYSVTYSVTGSGTKSATLDAETNLRIQIRDLHPGTSYTVTVYSKSGDRTSTGSTITITTKPSSVTQVLLEKRSSRSLNVSWTEPKGTALTHYHLWIVPNDGNEQSPFKVLSTSDLHHTFQRLMPGRAYTIRIAVLSGTQQSSDVSETLDTYPLPPTNLQVEKDATTTQSVKVTWKYDSTLSVCEKWRVKYTMTGQSDTPHVDTASSTVLFQIIEGLKAGQNYTISVYGVTAHDTVGDTAAHTAATVKPLAVSDLEADAKTSSNVDVSWKDTGDSYQDSYQLRFKGQHQSKTWSQAMVLKAKVKTVTDLFPGDQYTFGVKAVSNNQISAEREITTILYPLPPTGLSVSTTDTTSLKILWTHDATKSFCVKWKVKYTEKDMNKYSELTTGSVTNLDKTIDGLTPGKNFTIQVFGVTTSNVTSQTPTELDATTKPLAVSDLKAVAKTSSGVDVSWKDAGDSYQDSYQLRFKGQQQADTWSYAVVLKTKAKTVTGLFPGDQYTFEVKAVSNNQISAGSETTTILYPLPPTSVTLSSATTKSLKILWTHDATQSFCVKWKVRYTEKGKDDFREKPTGDVSEVQMTIGDLKPGVTYTIQVFAVTTNTVTSQTSAQLDATTEPLPVSDMKADAKTSSDADVSWKDAEDSYQDSYQLRFKGHHQAKTWSDAVVLKTKAKTVTGLFPGDQYTFGVKAVSNNQISAESETTAVLYPLPPTHLEVKKGETTTQSVKVVWQYDEGKSYCEKWRVDYTVMGTSDQKSVYTNDVRQLHMNITKLRPGQNYTITVYGVTVGGIVSQTTAEVKATVVPEIKTVLNENTRTDTDSVVVDYSPVNISGGVFDRYFFSINDQDKIKSKEDDDTSRTVQFDGLEAGTLYTVTAWSKSGSRKSRDIFTQIRTVPNKPKLQCILEEDAITIDITQGDGKMDKFSLTCNNCNDTSRHEGINQLRYTNLVPYTIYSFKATAIAGSESNHPKESETFTIDCKTSEGPPFVVQDLHVTYAKPLELLLSWTEPRVKNGELLMYTITYNGTYSGDKLEIPDVTTKVITVEDASKTKYAINIIGLKQGYNYSFWVRAYNQKEGHLLQISYPMPFLEPPTEIPLLDAKPETTLTDENDKSTLKHNHFQIKFRNPFSNKYGSVESYSVIVTKDPDDSYLHKDDILYWSAVQKSDVVSTYVAIEKCVNLFSEGDSCWNNRRMVKRAAEANDIKEVKLTVGGDELCEKDKDVACNGALSSSTTYYVKLRAYTDGNKYTDTLLSEPITTASAPMPWGAIGGGVGAAIVIIVIAVIVVIVLKRRGFPVKKETYSSDMFIDPLRPSDKQKPDTRHQIKCTDFPAHWEKMNKDSQLEFAAEYEELRPVGTEQSQKIAVLPANRTKNRYTNIVPYDKTRIKLMSGGEEEEGNDYINGNWMPGYNSKREYAVVQGPLPGTKDDMWRMIWEHNARAIVMLTKCLEKGRDKCDHYWPMDTQPMFYGDLKVEIQSKNSTADWIVTKMKVSLGTQSRNITHFQYTDWPDFGVPDNPQSLIGFVRLVRKSLDPVGGPIVVHCSAGVGRSGTFIVLDRLLQHIEEHDWVDIYNTVYEMRLYRNVMVQTEAQYVCIHSCLLCVIECQEGSDNEGEDNEAYEDDEGYMVKA